MIGALQLPPIPNDSLDHLRSVIKGDIVVPGDEDYPTAIVRWCATAERPAGLVVYVKDEEDILSVLEVALKHKTDIAVRGDYAAVDGLLIEWPPLIFSLNTPVRWRTLPRAGFLQ
jgi:hypothetical protein